MYIHREYKFAVERGKLLPIGDVLFVSLWILRIKYKLSERARQLKRDDIQLFCHILFKSIVKSVQYVALNIFFLPCALVLISQFSNSVCIVSIAHMNANFILKERQREQNWEENKQTYPISNVSIALGFILHSITQIIKKNSILLCNLKTLFSFMYRHNFSLSSRYYRQWSSTHCMCILLDAIESTLARGKEEAAAAAEK